MVTQFSDGTLSPQAIRDDAGLLAGGEFTTCFSADILSDIFGV